ncbi:hypothetical protein AB0M79_11515 [Polymorphospora sp. NPDC051019]|uniref:hypothetical protein n=1 Tax=Polymorphospora sp. NPDC051019 TaxID=3155725 RepID=UPI00341A4CC9
MSRWFHRAVGTVGVAGGFLLLTGGAAQADPADATPQAADPQQVQGAIDKLLTPTGTLPDLGLSELDATAGEISDGVLTISRNNAADGSREAAPDPLTGQLPDLADVPVDRLLAGELRMFPGLGDQSAPAGPAVDQVGQPVGRTGATADAIPAMVTSAGEQVPALIGDALMAQKPELFGGTESLPVVDTLPVVGGLPVVGDLTHGGVPLVGSLPLVGDPSNLVGPAAAGPTTQPATTQPATTRPATTQPATTQPATTQPATGDTATRPATGPAPSTAGGQPARGGERSFNGTGRPVAGEDPDYAESASSARQVLPASDGPQTLPAFDGPVTLPAPAGSPVLPAAGQHPGIRPAGALPGGSDPQLLPAFDGLQTLPAQGGRPATSTVAPMVMSIDRTLPAG